MPLPCSYLAAALPPSHCLQSLRHIHAQAQQAYPIHATSHTTRVCPPPPRMRLCVCVHAMCKPSACAHPIAWAMLVARLMTIPRAHTPTYIHRTHHTGGGAVLFCLPMAHLVGIRPTRCRQYFH